MANFFINWESGARGLCPGSEDQVKDRCVFCKNKSCKNRRAKVKVSAEAGLSYVVGLSTLNRPVLRRVLQCNDRR